MNEFENIIISYWKGSELKKDFIKHNTEIKYSETMKRYFINKILNEGYNIMTQRSKETFIIWISENRFTVS